MVKGKRTLSATILDPLAHQILSNLLTHFTTQNFTSDHLQDGYEGLSLSDLEKLCHVNSPAMKVDFDLAFKQLEDADLIKTGPMVPYDDTADSALVFLGLWSKRDYAYLTESGYRLARNSRQGIERF